MQRLWKCVAGAAVMALAMATAAPAAAQTGPDPAGQSFRRWSADVAFGFDNSISGNINSSGVGTLNNQIVVVLSNPYEKVYGTGLHFRFGGGYMIDEISEVRLTFTFQSLDADLTPMGDIGSSRLYGQYADYQSFGMDAGFRRYVDFTSKVRGYGEGTIGIAVIDETDVVLVAPTTNLAGNATDFYDKTAAFTMGGNAGVLFQVTDRLGAYGQFGLRYVTGMAAVDGLRGTGLETINDHSARWTLPVIAGIRFQF